MPVETEVIRALVCDDNAYDRCSQYLKPGAKLFDDSRNATIFQAIAGMKANGEPVDAISLRSRLESSRSFKAIGKDHYLDVTDGCITTANVEYHTKLLYEAYLRRSLKRVAGYIASKSDEGEDVFGIAETVISQMQAAMEGANRITLHTCGELFRETIREYGESVKDGGKSQRISTGIKELDDLNGGWGKQQLIVIGARPGVGKSNLALHFLAQSALTNPTLFISVEMSKDMLSERIIASQSGVGDAGFRTYTLSQDELGKVVNAIDSMSDTVGKNLVICDNPSMSIADVEVMIRRAKREYGIKLVAIDYLQLITSSESKRTREQEVADISRRLKAAAKENDIPILALAQINRDANKEGKDVPPKKHQLRDSGQIEQDADAILLLHRFEREVPDGFGVFSSMPAGDLIHIDLAKNRRGMEGWFFVRYDRTTGRISSVFGTNNPVETPF